MNFTERFEGRTSKEEVVNLTAVCLFKGAESFFEGEAQFGVHRSQILRSSARVRSGGPMEEEAVYRSAVGGHGGGFSSIRAPGLHHSSGERNPELGFEGEIQGRRIDFCKG